MASKVALYLSLVAGAAAANVSGGAQRFRRVVRVSDGDSSVYEPPRGASVPSAVAAPQPRVGSTLQRSNDSEPRCFSYASSLHTEDICMEDHYHPRCPGQFVDQAHWSCLRLVSWLRQQEGGEVTGFLTWWTSKNCLVHKTRCEVTHAKYGHQYEEDIFDFHHACENIMKVSYHYSYLLPQTGRDADDNTRSIKQTASVQLHNGSFGTIFQMHDSIGSSRQLVRQKDLQILVYEKNNRGHLVVGDQRVDTRVDSSINFVDRYNPRGLWAHFIFRVKYRNRQNKLVTEMQNPLPFHVSPSFSLSSDCPDQSVMGRLVADDSESSPSISTTAAIAIALAVFVALFFGTWAIRQTIMRARAENTRAAAEANEKRLERELEAAKQERTQRVGAPIPVENMAVVNPEAFTGGPDQVVRGIVVSAGSGPREELPEAPDCPAPAPRDTEA